MVYLNLKWYIVIIILILVSTSIIYFKGSPIQSEIIEMEDSCFLQGDLRICKTTMTAEPGTIVSTDLGISDK